MKVTDRKPRDPIPTSRPVHPLSDVGSPLKVCASICIIQLSTVLAEGRVALGHHPEGVQGWSYLRLRLRGRPIPQRAQGQCLVQTFLSSPGRCHLRLPELGTSPLDPSRVPTVLGSLPQPGALWNIPQFPECPSPRQARIVNFCTFPRPRDTSTLHFRLTPGSRWRRL